MTDSLISKLEYDARSVNFCSIDSFRQASVALNVWQPEVVRGRHMQIVEQSALPVDSRVHALEMELKLCRQQICSFEIAYVSCEIF